MASSRNDRARERSISVHVLSLSGRAETLYYSSRSLTHFILIACVLFQYPGKRGGVGGGKAACGTARIPGRIFGISRCQICGIRVVYAHPPLRTDLVHAKSRPSFPSVSQ